MKPTWLTEVEESGRRIREADAAKKAAEEFSLLADSRGLMPCPFCGAAPKFKSSHETWGHGSGGLEWWIECACGIRTKAFDTYMDSNSAARAKAAAVWNQKRG